jgi:hypothetical protein
VIGSARPGARLTPRRPLVAPILPALRQAPVRGSVKILSSGNAAVRKQRWNFVRTRLYFGRLPVCNQKSASVNELLSPAVTCRIRKSAINLKKIPNDVSCPSREFAYSPYDANAIHSRKMIRSNSSYPEYRISEGVEFGRDRLPLGPALFAVFGLSLIGWGVVLAPLVAILHH